MLAKRICLLVCLFAPVGLLSQTSPPQSPPTQVPPGWVDGSKHPELIPDHASYRLVLIHLSSMTATGQDTRIHMIGLSGLDIQTLKNEVALFKKDYDLWKAHAGTQPSDQDDKAAKAMALASKAAILSQLSTSGAITFTKYVEREKVRMVVKP